MHEVFYLAFVGFAILVEHWLFGKRWKRNEFARWTMGIITVLAPMFFLDGVDLYTLILTLFGFGVAGAVLGTMKTDEDAHTRQKVVTKLKKQFYNEQDSP